MNLAFQLDRSDRAASWPQIVDLLRLVHGQIALAAPPSDRDKPPADLLAWGRTFLPTHFTKPPSAMHRWLADWLDRMQQQRGLKLKTLYSLHLFARMRFSRGKQAPRKD
jgi:hypothetical protein